MRYEIRYRLTPQMALQEGEAWARLFCGVGAGKGDVDQMALQDGRKRPLIPGATIKGLLREKYIDLLEACGVKIDLRGKNKDFRHLRTHPLVTAVFGSPGQSEARSVFTDLRPLYDERLSVSWKRNRIDRRLGRPADEALFGVEYLLCLSLEGTIRMWLPNPPPREEEREEVDLVASLLLGALKLLFAVGGHTSTGAGLVKVEVVRLVFGGRASEMAAPEGQEILRRWLAPLGGGEELRSALERRSQRIEQAPLPMAAVAYHFSLRAEEGGV